MFTDERSPFQPPRRTATGLLVAIVLSVAAATAIRWSASDQTSLQKPAAQGAPNTAVAPDPLPPFSRAPVDRQAPAPRPAVAREARPPTMTIYLCKGYAGESFWSDTLCSQQRATIDRMTTVPSDLSFEQQVAIARAQANEAARLYIPPVPAPAAAVGPSTVQTAPDGVCVTLNRELEAIDAWARSPQSGQMQDWIRQRRMDVQAQRASHRC